LANLSDRNYVELLQLPGISTTNTIHGEDSTAAEFVSKMEVSSQPLTLIIPANWGMGSTEYHLQAIIDAPVCATCLETRLRIGWWPYVDFQA
jgi:hypothetical protein